MVKWLSANTHTAESFKGRTTDFGSVYLGSNPGSAAHEKAGFMPVFL